MSKINITSTTLRFFLACSLNKIHPGCVILPDNNVLPSIVGFLLPFAVRKSLIVGFCRVNQPLLSEGLLSHTRPRLAVQINSVMSIMLELFMTSRNGN